MSNAVRFQNRTRSGVSMLTAAAVWMVIAAGAGSFYYLKENGGFGRVIASISSPGGETSESAADALEASFSFCSGPVRINCVVDGDTFWFRGKKIRIADIDTPELSPPRCAHEAQLGKAAKNRLLALLNAGRFSLAAPEQDEDRYRRKLRIVYRDGQSIGDALVAEGLARRWEGFRRSWCG